MDNFGSQYQVGGFAQGFGQGMGLANQQQELAMKKQTAQREQEQFERIKAQDKLRGAYGYLDQVTRAHLQGQDVDTVAARNTIDKVHQEFHLPTIGEYQSPEMGEHIDVVKGVENDVKGGTSLTDAMNKPEVTKSFNWRYNRELNYDKDGKPLNEVLPKDTTFPDGTTVPKGSKALHREIDHWTPSPDGQGLVPELRVSFVGPDGKSYQALDPMTNGRTVLPGDSQIKSVPAEKLIDQHISDTMFWKALNNPEVKASLAKAYLDKGGKPEELEPYLGKKQAPKDEYWTDNTDPKHPVYKYGPVVRDYQNNVISRDGIPTSAVPTAGYYRGQAAAEYKSQFSKGQQNAIFDKWVDAFKGQVNPTSGKNYTKQEAEQMAMQWQSMTELHKKLLPVVAAALIKENQFTGKSSYDIYSKLLQDSAQFTGSYSSPGMQPPQAQPQAAAPEAPPQERTIVDTGKDKQGNPVVKYSDGSIEAAPSKGSGLVPPPKPSVPAPAKVSTSPMPVKNQTLGQNYASKIPDKKELHGKIYDLKRSLEGLVDPETRKSKQKDLDKLTKTWDALYGNKK